MKEENKQRDGSRNWGKLPEQSSSSGEMRTPIKMEIKTESSNQDSPSIPTFGPKLSVLPQMINHAYVSATA